MPKSATSVSQDAPWTQFVLGLLFIMGLVFVVYSPALRGEFLWDDDVLIFNNELVRSPDAFKDIWFSTRSVDYFPLTSSVFWLEWRLFRWETAGYHVVNLLLHGLSAALFWRVLQKLKVQGAFVAAILFAIHPVCVSSAAWISELKNTLSLVLLLIAALFYLRGDPSEENGKADGRTFDRNYWVSLLFFVLSLLAKTSVVMLPVLLLGIAWWKRGKISRQDIVRSAPFFVLSLAFGLITIWFQHHRAMGTESDPLLVRILAGGWAVWYYFIKSIVPTGLAMVQPRWEIQTLAPLAWLPLIGWLGFLAFVWWMRNRFGRGLVFGVYYFFITLFPVLGLFDMAFFTYSRVADHFNYLSVAGVVALLAAGISGAWKKTSTTMVLKPHSAFVPVSAVVVALFSFLSWSYAHVFASPETLWNHTLKKNPKAWVAYSNLGTVLAARENTTQAIEYFQKALELNPKYTEAWNNLGSAYSDLKRYDEAIDAFRSALDVQPDYSTAENNWGLALARSGRSSQAIQHFEKALKLTPDYPQAHFNLGIALVQQEKLKEAAEHYRAAVKGNPEYVDARLNLAMVLSDMNELDQAVAEFDQTIRLEPELAEAYNGLGIVMVKQKNWLRAVQNFEQAVRLDPENSNTRGNLAKAKVRLEREGSSFSQP